MPRVQSKRKRYTFKSSYKRKSKNLRGVKKFIRLLAISISGLFFFCIAFYLYTLTQNIKKPFANASDGVDFSEKSYDSTRPFNILAIELKNIEDRASDIVSLYIYHLDTIDSKSFLLKVPVNVNVEYPRSLEEPIPIYKFYSLGNAGNESSGVELTGGFIRNYLAINADGYIIYDKNTVAALKDLGINFNKENIPDSIKYSDFLKISKLFEISRKMILSDLTSVEIIRLVGDIKNISNTSYEYVELEDSNMNDPKEFDSYWQELSNYTEIHSERLSVTILNGTSVDGVASWGARTVKNVKGIVLEVGNYSKGSDSNIIYTSLEKSALLDYVVNLHNVKEIRRPEDFEYDPFLAKRSDILLLLGKQTLSDF